MNRVDISMFNWIGKRGQCLNWTTRVQSKVVFIPSEMWNSLMRINSLDVFELKFQWFVCSSHKNTVLGISELAASMALRHRMVGTSSSDGRHLFINLFLVWNWSDVTHWLKRWSFIIENTNYIWVILLTSGWGLTFFDSDSIDGGAFCAYEIWNRRKRFRIYSYLAWNPTSFCLWRMQLFQDCTIIRTFVYFHSPLVLQNFT